MSHSSHPQSRSHAPVSSSANFGPLFSVSSPQPKQMVTGGGLLDDAMAVRESLVRSIKRSGLNRKVIADRMSYLLGRSVTEKMLNAFTAESRDDRRWPAEFDRAFCEATGDLSLIRDRARNAGLIVIEPGELQMLEFGRAYFAQKRAAADKERLEREIDGGAA